MTFATRLLNHTRRSLDAAWSPPNSRRWARGATENPIKGRIRPLILYRRSRPRSPHSCRSIKDQIWFLIGADRKLRLANRQIAGFGDRPWVPLAIQRTTSNSNRGISPVRANSDSLKSLKAPALTVDLKRPR
jgi:hypothetical protein